MALLNTNIGPERVQVIDRPLGTVQLPGASTSVTAFLISSSFEGAPENTPTRVTSLEEFESAFGGPDDILYDAQYAVQGYFDNGGTGKTAIIVNVGQTPTASDFIGSASDGSGLRALDAIDDVNLVCVPGLPLAMAYLVHPALIDYSETVRAEFGATLSTVFSLMAVPEEISKADTETTLFNLQSTGISGTGPYVVSLDISGDPTFASGTVTVLNYLDLNGDSITLDGTTLTEGTEWDAATGNSETATDLASAINTADIGFTAVAVGAVITITADDSGTAGNVALASSDEGDLSISGATLTGGGAGGDAADISSVTAGMLATNTGDSFRAVITAVDSGTGTITVATNPAPAFNSGNAVLLKLPSAVSYKEEVINNPSRVASWYFNNVIVLDRSEDAEPGDLLIVDPIGHVAGVMGRIDANIAIGGVSHAPAGIKYAGLAGIQGLSLSLSERLDAEPLRLNFINRLQSFPGSGNVVFGGYTAESGTSPVFTADEQLIQVMRSIQYIKASLEVGLRGFLWENFSPETQSAVERSIESFLRNNIHLFPAGLPETQQFRVIRVEATQDELDQGLLRVRLQVKPNKAVRFIEVALEFPLPLA